MKKTLFIITVMMVSFSMLTIAANDKKKKSITPAAAPERTVLANSNDTLSYAAGMSQTNGLIPYLTSQLKVDTAYMADFIAGFKEAMNKTEDPSYNAHAAGIEIAKMLKERLFPSIENELKGSPEALVREKFVEGFVAALKKDTSIYNQQTSASYFEARMKANHEAKQERLYGANREAGKKFLAENAKKEGVVTTPSGLQYKILTKGTGPIPTAAQEVKVKYEGKLLDGTIFDSSYKRSDPITKFRCNQVIKGWTEALTMMPVGSTWELYIPYELAYGDADQGKIKPYSMLIFKVELVGIEGLEPEKPAEAVKAAPVKAAPKKAAKRK